MTPLSLEAVAQMVADLHDCEDHNRTFLDFEAAADMITTLSAENAVLRADAAKALQWAKEQHACADEYAAEVVALRASEAAALARITALTEYERKVVQMKEDFPNGI